MNDVALAFVILASAVVVMLAVPILGLGAWIWANAFAAIQRARVHAASADAQEAIDAAAIDALPERPQPPPTYMPPSDDELREAIFAGRASTNGHVEDLPTTLGNEGMEENENPFDGGMYRT